MNTHLTRSLCGGGLAIILICSTGAAAQPDWRDRTLAPDERAELVIGLMTPEEKIAMLHGTFGSAVRRADPSDKRVGAGHVPGVPRLGIPDLYETDGSVGIANGGNIRPGDVATALPSSLATAATFDRELAFSGGVLLGAEARAKGFNVVLAGGVNLVRDPWNGRNFEYLSEDVWLTAVMGGEAIRGVQSNKVISTIKHFVLNSQESGRYVLDARIPEAALRESDLLAFELAMERGDPGSVMCGYNKINGDWACENSFLLTDVLRRDWRFEGWVMSDWGGVHSTAKSANAGLDQESGQELDQAVYFGDLLQNAVARGAVAPARIDQMVHRILRTMFAYGVIDSPAPKVPEQIDYAAHAKTAQAIAEASIVLLKNDGGLLPASTAAKKILVIGGHADVGVLSGGGSSQVAAVSGLPIRQPLPNGQKNLAFLKVSYQGSSPLMAIRQQAPQADVTYLDGSDVRATVSAARQADIVFLFATQWRTEALDLTTLSLPDQQDALIDAVATANPRTAVVLESGGAVLMPWLGKVGAVLEAWYPGEAGGPAIARVLFGKVDASGRLPITFPASDRQMPRPDIPGIAAVREAALRQASSKPREGATTVDISGGVKSFPVDYTEGADVGYRWYEKRSDKPLFAFGYGLSYTRFNYSGLSIAGGKKPVVRFTIRNTGTRAGSDVPQVYAGIARADGSVGHRLVGFERVQLAPGESRRVTLTIEPRLLSSFDTTRRRWVFPKGRISLAVGPQSQDLRLSKTLATAMERLVP